MEPRLMFPIDLPTEDRDARAIPENEVTAALARFSPELSPAASAPIRNVTSFFANYLPSFIVFFKWTHQPLHRKDKEPLGVSYACNRATKVRTSFQAKFKLTSFN